MAIKDIRAKELRNLIRTKSDDLEIIDVREPFEYKEVRIKKSKNIPMGELPARINEIDWSKEVIFVCRSGNRSRFMAEIAAASGKDVKNLQFGILECGEEGGEFLEFSEN